MPEWWPDWSGQTCILVAGGPSVSGIPIYEARGQAKFIAINRSWEIAPWADMLFGCDYAWWKSVDGCPQFGGLKLSTERRVIDEPWGVKQIGIRKGDDRLLLEPLGTVGWGGNSGFQAFNLAAQFGCSKVILVGFDATVEHGLHWFGRHAGKLNNPTRGTTERWRRAMDGAAKAVEARGIVVLNCSPISALRNYPKVTFDEAMAR